MKLNRLSGWFAFFTLMILPCLAFGSGYAINDQSARAVAMGNAFVAQADDPSALYYNPAGLVQTEGIQAMVNATAVFPTAEFDSTTKDRTLGGYYGKSTKILENEFYIPSVYITQKYNDKFAWGIGGFSNFGLEADWPDYWEGRYTPGGLMAEIKTQSINPVFAYQPCKYFSASVGYVAQHMEAEMANMINLTPLGQKDAWYNISGDDWGHGWNAGVMFYFPDEFRIGASYRSEVHHDLVGDLNIYGNPNVNMHSGGTLSVNLPDIFMIGVSWTKAPFTIEFDYQWTGWSTYDSLQVNVDKTGAIGEVQKVWDDASAYHLGGSYTVVKNLDLRAGISYEPEMIPHETLDFAVPGGDRWIYSVGFGGRYGNWVADFSYSYLHDDERTFNNELGDYVYLNPGPTVGRLTGTITDVSAHIVGVGVTYKF